MLKILFQLFEWHLMQLLTNLKWNLHHNFLYVFIIWSLAQSEHVFLGIKLKNSDPRYSWHYGSLTFILYYKLPRFAGKVFYYFNVYIFALNVKMVCIMIEKVNLYLTLATIHSAISWIFFFLLMRKHINVFFLSLPRVMSPWNFDWLMKSLAGIALIYFFGLFRLR